MLCSTTLLVIVTCACVTANNGPFGPLGPVPFSIDHPKHGQIAPHTSSILPISPITPISPVFPPTYSEIPLLIPSIPPGLCIPDVIRIPLVPCPLWPPNDLPIQPLHPIVVPPQPFPSPLEIIPIPSPFVIPNSPLQPTPGPFPWPTPYHPEINPLRKPLPFPYNGPYPNPEPFLIPLPHPDDETCDLQNPGFVAEYIKALQLFEKAIYEIKSHISSYDGVSHDSSRQYLAILEVWRRLQLVKAGNGAGISTTDYKSLVEETVPLALHNPVLVAEHVNLWVTVNLQAIANIRALIQNSLRWNLDQAEFNIASYVRQNTALQLEANLLLQIGEASSAYLTLASTFERISHTGCVVPYLVNSQYDLLQLVEKCKPALQSLSNEVVPFGPASAHNTLGAY